MATDRRGHLGVQRRSRTAAKIHVQLIEFIGLELLAVHRFRGPATGAVEKATLARCFRVCKDVCVALEVRHRTQFRGEGLDALLRIALDHIFRHPPAFIRILHRVADGEHLSRLFCLDPRRTAPGPFFGDDLDVIAGQRHFHADGAAGEGIGGVAVAFLDDEPQDLGGEAAAFPGDVAELDGFGLGGTGGAERTKGEQGGAEQQGQPVHGVWTRAGKDCKCRQAAVGRSSGGAAGEDSRAIGHHFPTSGQGVGWLRSAGVVDLMDSSYISDGADHAPLQYLQRSRHS